MAFGDFQSVCEKAPLPLCTLVNPLGKPLAEVVFGGILPTCYARTVNLANTLIFEVGTAFINIGNLIILLMIIYLVRQRYTSVARGEMLFFFWCLVANTIMLLVVDTGVTPPGSVTYAYFVSAQIALEATCCWALLFAGLSGFNFWDDGSKSVMFTLYTTALAVFVVNYFVSVATFKSWGSVLNPSATTALYVFVFVLNPLLLGLWFLSQVFICLFTLMFNWWAMGALGLTAFFFSASQVLLYGFSHRICESINHYADGSIFSSLAMTFCYMMIYKYWDIITFDDDEYYRFTEVVSGVGSKEEARSLLK